LPFSSGCTSGIDARENDKPPPVGRDAIVHSQTARPTFRESPQIGAPGGGDLMRVISRRWTMRGFNALYEDLGNNGEPGVLGYFLNIECVGNDSHHRGCAEIEKKIQCSRPRACQDQPERAVRNRWSCVYRRSHSQRTCIRRSCPRDFWLSLFWDGP